jgi:hypothetical protein
MLIRSGWTRGKHTVQMVTGKDVKFVYLVAARCCLTARMLCLWIFVRQIILSSEHFSHDASCIVSQARQLRT